MNIIQRNNNTLRHAIFVAMEATNNFKPRRKKK